MWKYFKRIHKHTYYIHHLLAFAFRLNNYIFVVSVFAIGICCATKVCFELKHTFRRILFANAESLIQSHDDMDLRWSQLFQSHYCCTVYTRIHSHIVVLYIYQNTLTYFLIVKSDDKPQNHNLSIFPQLSAIVEIWRSKTHVDSK